MVNLGIYSMVEHGLAYGLVHGGSNDVDHCALQ